MPITHEQYEAEQAKHIERYLLAMCEAQDEYEAWLAQQGASAVAYDGERKKRQGRRRKNTPVLTGKPQTLCTCGCGRKACAKGMCEPCYMKWRRDTVRCGCGCGRAVWMHGYARTCLRRMEREELARREQAA